MTEEQTPPEEVPAVDPHLQHVKHITIERMISHMSGVGASIVQRYPMAEVESWPIQRGEAESIVSTPAADMADAQARAPFLLQVTIAHFGDATDAERLAQLNDKAVGVKAKADIWAALSAFVNGLRARADDRIEAATTSAEVLTIESEIATELEAFRAEHGV